jgi:hypothetical protein
MTLTGAEQRFLARQPRGTGHLAAEIIRIRPRRVLSFNVDPDNPGFAARDIAPAGDSEVA